MTTNHTEPTTYRSQSPVSRPLRPAVRIVLIVLGTLSLGLGIVGLVLPVLPTTPFLVISAGCYLRSSDRLSSWLINHPRLGPSVRRYVAQRAIPRTVKIVSLIVAWVVLGGTALFVVESVFLKVLLVALAIAKTVFMIRVKTLRNDA